MDRDWPVWLLAAWPLWGTVCAIVAAGLLVRAVLQ